MNQSVVAAAVSIICVILLFFAGCSSYAEPEITMNTSLKQVGANLETHTISYDVILNIGNDGSNNAYDVVVMVLVSTPKDLPEYRFVNENIEIGTIPKHESTSVTRQLSLPMTQENYNRIIRGERDPEVETKVIRMSSNIMG